MSERDAAAWASDHSNPIVVKEIRQAVKSRAYIGLFLVLLFVCVVISLLACGSYLRSDFSEAIGDDIFAAFLICLWITGYVLMPMGAFHSLSKERTENTFELLNISGLGPGRIVRGKLGAAMIQLGLIYSAFVPFMAFSYFLRGIDLPQMIYLIVGTFLMSVFFIMLAVSLSAVAANTKIFGLVRAGFFFVLIISCLWLLQGGVSLFFFGHGWFSTPNLWDMLEGALVAALVFGSYFVILYLLAVSRLTFVSDNRSSALKVALFVQSLIFAGIFLYYAIDTSDDDPWVAFSILMAIHWAIVGVFVTTEPENLSRRVATTVPKSGLVRLLAGHFWPGCNLGWAYLTINMFLLLVGYYVLASSFIPAVGPFPGFGFYVSELLTNWSRSGSRYEELLIAPLIISYTFIYLGLTSVIGRLIASRQRNPYVERLLAVILFTVGVALPWLFEGIGASRMMYRNPWLHLSNPFAMELLLDYRSPGPVLTILALGAFFLIIHVPAMLRGYLELGRLAKLNRSRQDQRNSNLEARSPDDGPTA